MAIKSYTVGPGSLVFGSPGSPGEQAAQVTSCTVSWEVAAEDDTPVLSGEVDPGEETYTFTLSGNVLQDITATGLVPWSWLHKGEVTEFVYIPNSSLERQITGEVKVQPLDAGGDVKAKANSDFEWPGVGEPAFGDVA